MQRVHLTPDEVGLIMWVTAHLVDLPEADRDNPKHPVTALKGLHGANELHTAAKRIEANFNGPGFCWIEGPVDEVTSDILRVSVEMSDYAALLARDGHEERALDSVDALRSLAHKLEELGIEVAHLPDRNSELWSIED